MTSGLTATCPLSVPHPASFPEEDEVPQSSSAGSTPGGTPQGPPPGPDGHGSDSKDPPPKDGGWNFFRTAGNWSLGTSPPDVTSPHCSAQSSKLSALTYKSPMDPLLHPHCQKRGTVYTGDEVHDALESQGRHFRPWLCC